MRHRRTGEQWRKGQTAPPWRASTSRGLPKCDATGKTRYGTKKKAARAKDQVNESSFRMVRERPVTYVYRCAVCGDWHLTSREHGTGRKADAIVEELRDGSG